MNSASEEILRLSTERLKNKVESIMFNINIILSNPDKHSNQVEKVSELLIELALAESAMKHSQALFTQCLEIRLKELSSQIEQNKTEE